MTTNTKVSSVGNIYDVVPQQQEREYTIKDLRSISFEFKSNDERIKILESVLKKSKQAKNTNLKNNNLNKESYFKLSDYEIIRYEKLLKELKQKKQSNSLKLNKLYG